MQKQMQYFCQITNLDFIYEVKYRHIKEKYRHIKVEHRHILPKSYKVIHKRWDFKDDCTEFIHDFLQM